MVDLNPLKIKYMVYSNMESMHHITKTLHSYRLLEMSVSIHNISHYNQ